MALSKVQKSEAASYAVELLRHGFRARIVHIETGVQLPYLRGLAKELNNGARMPSGSLASSGSILNSRAAVMEASLWAGLYRSMAGREIYKRLFIDLVKKSHDLYLDLRLELPWLMQEPLSINRAWVLARDLRSDMAWLSRCHCGSVYIHAQNQRCPSSCPACDYARGGC